MRSVRRARVLGLVLVVLTVAAVTTVTLHPAAGRLPVTCSTTERLVVPCTPPRVVSGAAAAAVVGAIAVVRSQARPPAPDGA